MTRKTDGRRFPVSRCLAALAAALLAAAAVGGFSNPARRSDAAGTGSFLLPGVGAMSSSFLGRSSAPGSYVAMPGQLLLDSVPDRLGVSPRALQTATIAAAALLLWNLMAMLDAWPAAAAAWVLVAAWWTLDAHTLAYVAWILLCAGALAWRAERPTLGRALVVAVVLGASLLERSALAFLPLVLAAQEAWTHRRAPRARWREIAVLGALPYAALAPWLFLNWKRYGHAIPFEVGQANSNVVAGALGLVGTLEGDWRALISVPIDYSRPGAVLGWALAEAAAHPARYAAGFFRRIEYAFFLRPLIFTAALASAAWRRDARLRVLGLFSLYYLVAHCLMAVEPRYFEPLWPPLCCLGGAAVWRLVSRRGSTVEDLALGRASRALFAAFAAGAAVWGLCVGAVVLEAAFRPEREELAPPSASDGLMSSVRARLDAGEGAEADAIRLARLLPDEPEADLLLARAEIRAGKPADALAPLGLLESLPDQALRASPLRLYALTRLGRKSDAAAERDLLCREAAAKVFVRGPDDDRAEAARLALRDSLRGEDLGILDGIRADPAMRRVVLDALLSCFPRSRDLLLENAEGFAAAGDRGGAASALARVLAQPADLQSSARAFRVYRALGMSDLADRLRARLAAEFPADDLARALAEPEERDEISDLDRVELQRAALELQARGNYPRAIRILARLSVKRPTASVFADLGLCQLLAGRRGPAAASLRRAIDLDPEFLPAYLTLGNDYLEEGRVEETIALYDRALAQAPVAGEENLRATMAADRAGLLKAAGAGKTARP